MSMLPLRLLGTFIPVINLQEKKPFIWAMFWKVHLTGITAGIPGIPMSLQEKCSQPAGLSSIAAEDVPPMHSTSQEIYMSPMSWVVKWKRKGWNAPCAEGALEYLSEDE